MRRRSEASPLDVLKWPLRLTWTGLWAERVVRAFWPLWTLLLVIWATIASRVLSDMPIEVTWFALVAAAAGALFGLWYGVKHFGAPRREEALLRLDQSMPGRPIQAATDDQAIGAGDQASEAVWNAHVARMETQLRAAQAVPGDLRVSSLDRFGLRYIALLLFAISVTFGGFWGYRDDAQAGAGTADAVVAGPSWEAWIEPPAYTGKPSIYLNDVSQAAFDVPEGSLLTVRFYGKIGSLSLQETISQPDPTQVSEADAPPQMAFSRNVAKSGVLTIEGADGASWDITVIPDARPQVEFSDEITRRVTGDMEVPFSARDDYGVERGSLTITLDMKSIDRRYGLAVEPEGREPVILDLPMPIRGGREDFTETLVENLAEHPWAGLPVQLSMTVSDAIDQDSELAIQDVPLPGRRFFQPIARAVIEQRRDLLWSRENGPRTSQILRTVTHRPDGYFPSEQAYMMLRMAITRLDIHNEYGLTVEKRDEIADLLWRTAVLLEEGRLNNALEKLRRAQERLSEAMEQGATDEEIAELMDELREAMREYMEQLAEQSESGENQQAQNQQGEMQEITGDQLQEMMDEIQRLMEEGRMAEAQQLLDQLMEMMQNMQVARNQQGQQGQQGEGQQAMEGLQETLREQQGLSDEAFRDLQEQSNPGSQAGESQENTGRSGGQGRGQSHEGGQGGQADQNQGQGNNQNQQADGQSGSQEPGSLADRQQALRDELQRQQRNLPGAGTPEGDAARDALGRAGEAMDRAEDALRDDRTADALGHQADAMEALREGMRNLGDAMAQQQQQGGQQGQQQGQANRQNRDPLGRESGSNGMIGTDENMLQGEDARRRSRELLDEIRRRSGEQERPELERDYLRRLLDRF